MEQEIDNYTNCDCFFGTITKGLLKGLEDLKIGGRVKTIIENGQKSKKSSGDLLSLKLQ